MSWKEQLRRVDFTTATGETLSLIGASFRGKSFFVESAEHTGGRRGVTHEFPFRDESFREDLGRGVRGYTLDGYVIGDNYLAERDALLAALETSGPGELVHPYFGTKQVAATSFRVRESTAEGGLARFSLEFEETPAEAPQPVAVLDTAGALRSAASVARTAVEAEFLAAYTPGIHRAALTTLLQRAATATSTAAARISLSVQEAAAVRRKVDAVASGAASLIVTPQDMLGAVAGLLDGFGVGGFWAALSLYAFDPGPRPEGETASRQREQANYDALYRLTRRLSVIRAAELALEVTFESYDAAVAARLALTDPIDEQADLAGDELYPTFVQLRADVVRAVPGADGDLPRLRTVTPVESTPSLVLAYQLYGNLDLEADIIARNGIQHPGFLVGGQPLEVLTDG